MSRLIVLAGDTVWHPDDVEVWEVTEEDYEYMMEYEKGYRSITPLKGIGIESLASGILED